MLWVAHAIPTCKFVSNTLYSLCQTGDFVTQSAALAIGVSLPAICHWGIWVALDSVMRYLDPLVPRSRGALLFFAHLVRAAE